MRVCQGCPQCHHLPSSLSAPSILLHSNIMHLLPLLLLLSLPEVNMTHQLGAQKSVCILDGPWQRQTLSSSHPQTLAHFTQAHPTSPNHSQVHSTSPNHAQPHPTLSNYAQPCPSSPCLPQPVCQFLPAPMTLTLESPRGILGVCSALNFVPKRMSGHTLQPFREGHFIP